MMKSSQKGWKTLWEKGEIGRNCSLRAIDLFPTVFSKRLVLQTRKNQGLFGKALKCRLQFVSIWTSLKFCRLVMG